MGFWQRKYQRHFREGSVSAWIHSIRKFLPLFIFIYQTTLLVSFYLACERIDSTVILLLASLSLAGLIVDGAIIVSLGHMEQERKVEEQLAGLRMQRQTEQESFRLNRENARKMAGVRENMAQQLAHAEELLEQQQSYEQVREVLHHIYQDVQKTSSIRFCENPLLNSLLTIKSNRAKELGIDMKTRVHIGQNLPVSTTDLCSLFCNLLDNAFEACERIQNPDRAKEVYVKSECRGGYLILQVRNTNEAMIEKRGERFLTSKQEKDRHGLGLLLVQRIADRYNGMFELECGDGVVTVKVLLECYVQQMEKEQTPKFLFGSEGKTGQKEEKRVTV